MSRAFDSMLRLETEERISVKRARNLFKNHPSLNTVRNYITKGVISRVTLSRVYLDGYLEGSSYITSEQAVRRFLSELNGEEC